MLNRLSLSVRLRPVLNGKDRLRFIAVIRREYDGLKWPRCERVYHANETESGQEEEKESAFLSDTEKSEGMRSLKIDMQSEQKENAVTEEVVKIEDRQIHAGDPEDPQPRGRGKVIKSRRDPIMLTECRESGRLVMMRQAPYPMAISMGEMTARIFRRLRPR